MTIGFISLHLLFRQHTQFTLIDTGEEHSTYFFFLTLHYSKPYSTLFFVFIIEYKCYIPLRPASPARTLHILH